MEAAPLPPQGHVDRLGRLAQPSGQVVEFDGRRRSIALRRLEGYENAEIARELGCALRTVERRLALIRQIWEQRDEAGAG